MTVTASDLNALLERMPDIAKVVNAFQSEAVQQQAFRVLVRSFGSDDAEDETNEPDTQPDGKSAAPRRPRAQSRRTTTGAAKTTTTKKTATKKVAAKGSSWVKDLNLRPSGKESFQDFAKSKAPKNQHEYNTVAVYYLQQIVDIESVTPDHVYTCFREAKWRLPKDVVVSLRLTANKTGWLDTSRTQDIRLTAGGTNLVEHDLPPKPKAKAS